MMSATAHQTEVLLVEVIVVVVQVLYGHQSLAVVVVYLSVRP